MAHQRVQREIGELPHASTILASHGRPLSIGTVAGLPALFLDYDGTLAPIVSRPQDARLSARTRHVLSALAEQLPIAIVSGRSLADIQAHVGLPGLIYAGGHGFEIEGPNFAHRVGEAFLADVKAASESLSEKCARVDGAIVEKKPFSVAVHSRLVATDSQAAVRGIVDAVALRFAKLQVLKGKSLLELRPAIAWNKGHALRWILEHLPASIRPVVPIYIGDDRTDEDAFELLPPEGIGIVVEGGNAPTERDHSRTLASFYLATPGDVTEFLEALEEIERPRLS